jgi:hypothetical protein
MRFPDTPFMKRTFDLAKNRNLPVSFIPYFMQSPNEILFYNNHSAIDPPPTCDPFDVLPYLNDPTLTAPAEVSNKVAGVLEPFRALFAPTSGNDIATGMNLLFAATNRFSMRGYMFDKGFTAKDINWCETLDKSTGWYDRALTESTYFGCLSGFLAVT